MKSEQTQSTDPYESGYVTSTNLETTSRLAWCEAKFLIFVPNCHTKSQNSKFSRDCN